MFLFGPYEWFFPFKFQVIRINTNFCVIRIVFQMFLRFLSYPKLYHLHR